MSGPSSDDIDSAVCELLMRFGPDRHTDGSEELTNFILYLLSGRDVQTALDLTFKDAGKERR